MSAAIRAYVDDSVERWMKSGPGPKSGYSRLGFKLLKKDPIVETAKKLGYKVTEYDLPPYPVRRLPGVFTELLLFMVGSTVACYILYHYVSKNNSLLKHASIGAMISALLAWPAVTEHSGILLIDFWKPALGFRSALLVWDIFQIRTREEVESWNFPRFFCHLWAFPREESEIAEREKEEGFKRNAIWQNLKGMPAVIIVGIIMLMTIYFIPPYSIAKTLTQFQYHVACDAMGLCILMALSLFGDGMLKMIGMSCNVEMADMFENPLGTTSIRTFWSHWNRAIASVLHRVVFGGGRNSKSSIKSRSKKAANDASNGSAKDKRLAQLRRRHMDQLSETEAESKTDDEDDLAKRRARQNGLQMTSSNGPTNGSANGGSAAKKQQKPKSPFWPKAMAAMAAFAVSGIFHEYILAGTLGYNDGLNFLFFLINGVATVISTWFRRTYPEANAKIPTFAAVLMLHAFIFAVIPLFCSPFLYKDFFIQFEGLKYELLPWQSRKRGSFIYLV